MMTPEELVAKLSSEIGPCMRLCSCCPDDFHTAEVKECVEDMLKEIYAARRHEDELMRDLVSVLRAYRKETGHEYQFDENGN